jgi:hypothetical protein
MANLLSRAASPFPSFDQEQRVRFEERARFVVGRSAQDLIASVGLITAEVEADLEELDASPSLVVAQALLSRIDAHRRENRALGLALSEDVHGIGRGAGDWIGYRPARSLETGEAEIASRGFFDVRDRPPLGLWVDVVARARAAGSVAVDLAVLCYVPAEMEARAQAGRDLCPSGALVPLSDLSVVLDQEVRGLLD